MSLCMKNKIWKKVQIIKKQDENIDPGHYVSF